MSRKNFHSWKNILTKCVDNHTNMMYYKIEARVKTKPILYKPIFILPHFKFTPFNIEERQVIPPMTKHYYKAFLIYPNRVEERYWHCTTDISATLNCDFLIPLDRKPRNVEIREG